MIFDTWSLGVTLFEMKRGILGTSVDRSYLSNLSKDFSESGQFNLLISGCLQKDAAIRWTVGKCLQLVQVEMAGDGPPYKARPQQELPKTHALDPADWVDIGTLVSFPADSKGSQVQTDASLPCLEPVVMTPHICPACLKPFRYKPNLKRHRESCGKD